MEAQTETARPLKREGHMRQARNRFFLLLLFVVLACAGAFAQANSDVTGIVTDQTGAVRRNQLSAAARGCMTLAG